MKQLLKLIDNKFCDSDGWFRIISADWLADELRLEVSICLCEEYETELWEISCECVFNEKISSEYAEDLIIEGSHPLLIKYKEPEIDLAFSNNQMCSDELFGILVSCCFKHLGEQPMSNYLNLETSSEGICSSKYGILGCFPEIVANEICQLLKCKEISVNKLASHTPKYWNGENHEEYPENIEVLRIGSSYVVGTGFSAEKA